MLSIIIAHANLLWKTNGGFLRSYFTTCMNRAHLVQAQYSIKWSAIYDIFAQRDNNVENTWNHQRTIIYIQNHLFCIIGSVIDLDTIACPSVSSLRAIVMEFGMDIIVTYGTFSIIFILVTTDVVGDNWCGRFGLWPLRSVAVPVCGRFGLWPFRFVAVPVCGRSGLWPFRSVAITVCGRFGLWPFRFVAVSVVAVSVCGRYDLLPFCWHTLSKLVMSHYIHIIF